MSRRSVLLQAGQRQEVVDDRFEAVDVAQLAVEQLFQVDLRVTVKLNLLDPRAEAGERASQLV